MTTPAKAARPANPVTGSYRGAFASRDFSLLFIGQLGSEVGNGMVQLALPWLILDLTGSAFQLGFAYFCQFLPVLLFGMLGGVFADRWDRRLTIVAVNTIRATAFLSVAAIYYLGYLTIVHIYAVILLEATVANLFNPARAALLPNLVPPEHLRPANSIMEVARHIGFLPAPLVGAGAIVLLGPAAIFLFDGIAFLLAAFLIFMIRWRPPPRVVEKSDGWRQSVRNVIVQTQEGLGAIKRERLLQVSLLLGFSLNLIVAPIQILIPLFVREVKFANADYYGMLVGGLLVGLIVGSLTAPMNARRIGLGPLAIVAVLTLGVVICAAPWPEGLTVPVVAMAIAGAAIGSLNVAQTTMLQSATTDEERGRVSATYFTFSLGVRPPGFLVMGALASAVDIRFLFLVVGIAALSIGGLLFRLQEVREHR